MHPQVTEPDSASWPTLILCALPLTAAATNFYVSASWTTSAILFDYRLCYELKYGGTSYTTYSQSGILSTGTW